MVQMIQKRLPNTMIYTRFGQIPHLTSDLFDTHIAPKIASGKKLLQIPLPPLIDSADIIKTSGGVKNFCRLEKDAILHLSLLDPLGRRDIVSNNYLYFWHNKNRRQVDIKMYKSLVDSLQIDTYAAPFDFDISAEECSNKKNQKSLKRTINFMEILLTMNSESNEGLIPTLCGDSSLEYRILIARALNQLFPDTKAILIDFYQWSEIDGTKKFDEDFISEIIKNTTSHFPPHISRIVEGPFNPDQILFMVHQGIDLFDSSYATMLAEKGMAFVLDEKFPLGAGQQFTTINLNDQIYRDDHSCLFTNCDCYTCQEGYTRAYLNHLLSCKEMLAKTLLTIHNMSEWMRLFSILRGNAN